MTHKTKTVLKHIGALLLCLALGVGSFFLARYLYSTAGKGSGNQGLQMLGYFVYLICAIFGMGAFVHIRMVFSNARVHCKACGALGSLRSYRILEQHMASDNKHVSSEDIRLNMVCSSCGQEFPLQKRFKVSTYSAKYHVWKYTDVDKSVREYAAGKLWF